MFKKITLLTFIVLASVMESKAQKSVNLTVGDSLTLGNCSREDVGFTSMDLIVKTRFVNDIEDRPPLPQQKRRPPRAFNLVNRPARQPRHLSGSAIKKGYLPIRVHRADRISGTFQKAGNSVPRGQLPPHVPARPRR